MGLDIKQELRLSQQLILVPQLQLSLKLLQMPRLELEEYLKAELEANPALEEVTIQENKLEGERIETGAPDGKGTTTKPADAFDPESIEAPVKETKSEGSDDLYLEHVARESDIRIPDFAGTADRPSYENIISREGNLRDHLVWQLGLNKVSADVLRAAEIIVGNLDDNGYLDDELQSLAGQNQMDVGIMQEGLKAVQTLDPAGVGARDLKECLLIQIRQLGLERSSFVRAVTEGLDFVAKNDPKGLAKALDISLREAQNAVNLIKGLNPKPGRSFSNEEAPYVTPDLTIEKVGNDYEIRLNNQGVPSVVINPIYRALAQRRDLGEKEKLYVKDKIRSALWLIKSIDQRQKTIFKVATALVKFQRDFLDHGVGFLKPLTLRDIAREVGVHESTVSRVTSNKYAETPQGVLRLKTFFSTGMVTRQGTSISTESIKHDFMILLENENKRRPLSDMEIAKHLRMKGINISRRTVAKYREQAGIPPAFQRKQR